MKRVWLFTLVLCSLALSNCGSGSKSNEEQETTATDSVAATVVDPDTLLLDADAKAGIIPEAMDELFDDFIFGFDQSNLIQRERTRWPLTMRDIDGNVRKVAKEEWQHHFVFMGQDFAMVFWTNMAQMDLSSDTTLTRASVEQIYLHSREVHDYHFDRDSISGQWMLNAIESHPFEDHELCAFLDFYSEWATDSIFQRSHVANPLRYTTPSDDESETVSGTIDVDQWFTFAPMLPKDVLTNVRYGQTYASDVHIIMQMREPGSGMQTIFTFHRQGDAWRLTAFED